MKHRFLACATAAVIAVGLISTSAPAANAAPAGSTVGPKTGLQTVKLTSSKSITVRKQSYTRKYTNGGCLGYEVVSKPVLTKGGSSAKRAVFNRQIDAYIASQVDSIMSEALDGDNGQPCDGSTSGGTARIVVAASIYKDRYVSVALQTNRRIYDAIGSCNDVYRSFTFDLKTGKWPGLSSFASTNHNQLAYTWLAGMADEDDEDYLENFNHPTVPIGYNLGSEPWTVGPKGITFWSESGSHDRGCYAGPRHDTVQWRDILRPGDAKVRSRTTRVSGSKVTVTGRLVKVSGCSQYSCGTYYGVRNGYKGIQVWTTSKYDSETNMGSFAYLYFASKSNSAKPTSISFDYYD